MSIHNHASIDTGGLWGPLPRSGRNKKYMELLAQKVKQVVLDAYNDRRDGDLYYGKKEAEAIQRDSRLPEVYSKDVHRFRFVPKDGSREIWIINFASHTESLLGKTPMSARISQDISEKRYSRYRRTYPPKGARRGQYKVYCAWRTVDSPHGNGC